MMEAVRQSSTLGALQDRFRRDREFQFGDIVTAPAVTPAGTDNSEMKLIYGTRRPKCRPREIRSLGMTFLLGRDASEWARLSRMETRALIVSRRLAVQY